MVGGAWTCSFSRRSTEPEERLGRRLSVEAAKRLAEQHAQAHRCLPTEPWIQAERAWFLETTCGTYIFAPSRGAVRPCLPVRASGITRISPLG
jgi:hypothetical protein